VLGGGFGRCEGWMGDLLLRGLGGSGRLRKGVWRRLEWLVGVGHLGDWGGRRGGIDVGFGGKFERFLLEDV